MSDQWEAIERWAAPAPGSTQLSAYGINADGTRVPLNCEAIYVALDDERGFIISLSERLAGEGLAIRSMPERALSTGNELENTAQFSSLAVRAGGANLFYVNVELHGVEPG